MLRCLFLAFAAPMLIFASTATAQTAPVAGPKPVSRAEFIKKLDAGFGAVDTNHDGVWSKAELDTAQTRTSSSASRPSSSSSTPTTTGS